MTTANAHITDDQLRDALNEIDEGDFNVNTWQANFIESLLYKNRDRFWKLTPKQRASCFSMIEEHLGSDYFG